ncbi:hypothetical protein TNCV_2143811 [Trichonephila clavipes]|nr:hypothetical protein TNCV_2143811 [Trichonephila clavipes]
MELMGALLAARLAKEVKKILDQKCSTRAFFWMDSQVTLHWIKVQAIDGNPLLRTGFTEIQSLTDLTRGSTVPAGTTQQIYLLEISVDALTTNSSGGMDPRFYVKLTSDQRTG